VRDDSQEDFFVVGWRCWGFFQPLFRLSNLRKKLWSTVFWLYEHTPWARRDISTGSEKDSTSCKKKPLAILLNLSLLSGVFPCVWRSRTFSLRSRVETREKFRIIVEYLFYRRFLSFLIIRPSFSDEQHGFVSFLILCWVKWRTGSRSMRFIQTFRRHLIEWIIGCSLSSEITWSDDFLDGFLFGRMYNAFGLAIIYLKRFTVILVCLRAAIVVLCFYSWH
jgi:hypothetical protein